MNHMRRQRFLVGSATALLLVLGAGIARADDRQPEGSKGKEVDLGGLTSAAPADWQAQRAGQMRAYQFLVPRAEGDERDAEVVIFYFQGGGGSAQQNIERWKGFFVPPEGKTIDGVSKVDHFKVAGNEVDYLDVHGTYKYKARPFDPNAQEERRPNFRMIGVVFDTPKGPYFIRFVGPEKTVEQHKQEFDGWLKGFKQG